IIGNLREGLLMLEPMWVVAAIIGWSLWEMDRHNHPKQTKAVTQSIMVVALATLLAFIAIQVQNKGYAYHYLILLPWADVLIGAGVAHLATSMHRVDALPRGSNAFFVLVVLMVGSF